MYVTIGRAALPVQHDHPQSPAPRPRDDSPFRTEGAQDRERHDLAAPASHRRSRDLLPPPPRARAAPRRRVHRPAPPGASSARSSRGGPTYDFAKSLVEVVHDPRIPPPHRPSPPVVDGVTIYSVHEESENL